jgi:hypothetical protein
VEAPVMGVEPRGRHSKTGGQFGQLRNQEEPPLSRKGDAFAKGLPDRYEAPYETRVSRTVLGGPGGEIPPGYSTKWGNDWLTEPELFGERSNNSLTLQGGAPIRRGRNLPQSPFCT